MAGLAGLYEMLIVPNHRWLNVSGVLYFAWVVPVIPLLVILHCFYLKFLPGVPRTWFVAAAVRYIDGVHSGRLRLLEAFLIPTTLTMESSEPANPANCVLVQREFWVVAEVKPYDSIWAVFRTEKRMLTRRRSCGIADIRRSDVYFWPFQRL